MTDNHLRLSELLPLYIIGTITEQELSELNAMTGSPDQTRRIARMIMTDDRPCMAEDTLRELQVSTWNAITGKLLKRRKRILPLAIWAGSAAAVIIVALLVTPLREKGVHQDSPQAVMLVLANGEELALTGGINLATHVELVVDNESKSLTVNPVEGEEVEISWHSLIVPARNIYNLTLPDGSRVVLNANSRLTFPQRFDDVARVVYIEGEAYFSITEDSARPFMVKRGDFTATVLGTGFSVKSAGDEYITTLVSGSVMVDNGAGVSQILTPGQQAVMSGGYIEVRDVDVDYYTGWKDGYFVFRGECLSEVVRQIAEWYGLEYRIENQAKGGEKIRARIIRYDDFQDMIDIIEDIRNVSVENGRIVIR